MPQLPYPKFRAFTTAGVPLAGGKLYTYAAGTTDTPKAAYTNFALSTPAANPVVLDSAGEANIYLNGAYYLVLCDANDVQIWAIDNVEGIDESGASYAAAAAASAAASAAAAAAYVGDAVGKNRLINGCFRISQWNGTGAVTAGTATYPIDRWKYTASQASKLTMTQVNAAVGSPVYSSAYYTIAVATSATPGAAEKFVLAQTIEGLNIADWLWGTAAARAVTISFSALASSAGTYNIYIQNSALTRTYIADFEIENANTWTYFSLTIPGCTDGVWATDNTAGAIVGFNLGAGSTLCAAADEWHSGEYYGVTGGVNLVDEDANFVLWLANVQCELGSAATAFEHRLYADELRLCQRYFQVFTYAEVGDSYLLGTGQATAATTAVIYIPHSVQTRIAPTAISVSAFSHFRLSKPDWSFVAVSDAVLASPGLYGTPVTFTVASGLTAGDAAFLNIYNASAKLQLSGIDF